MNLDDLSTMVTGLLGEDRSAAGSKLFTQTQLESMINDSNQASWQYAVECSQSFFAKRKEVTVTGEVIDISGKGKVIDPAGVYLILSLDVEAWAGRWQALTPIQPQDSNQYQQYLAVPTPGVYPRAYYFEGDNLYLAPAPSDSLNLRVRYIPNCPDLIGTQEALGGYLTQFHGIVAYDAAIALAVKDQADPKGLIYLRDQMKNGMRDYLARRQRQRGRSIRYVGEY